MPTEIETICQWTGLPFTGRGKNHPAIREALAEAFELDVYDEVTQALARMRGQQPDADASAFVAAAGKAVGEAVRTKHGFAVIDDSARLAIYTATRSRTPKGALLLEHGYSWRREPGDKPGTYAWALYDQQGGLTTSTTALARLALVDAEAVRLVENGQFVTLESRARFREDTRR